MNLSRREILAALAATPLLGLSLPTWADEQNKYTFSLAPDAVVVNGQPQFLIGGSVDYFRHPRETWRDRLLKTKRAGLNAVMCYVPWNYHEPEEGKFDFTGDRDLPHFLDLCKELGLFMFLRAGPFTCGEWDAGSYPAWLATKGVTETRTNHGPTLEYIRRWYEQLIPIVAERQVTRGGAVVFVQQENEYLFTGRPEVQEYQDFLIHLMRKLGIDVPITDCNGSNKQVRRPESFQTLNNFYVRAIQNLRKAQPGKPVLVSEFYTHWIVCFGEKWVIKPGADVLQQQTFDCLAAGGMPFYYMFAGGTNFGFWGSRTTPADYSFLLPRYFAQGPITEGGALTENYFAIKATTQVAASLEQVFVGAVEKKSGVHLAGPISATARGNKRGTLLFISANDKPAGEKPSITLASGMKLEIPQAKITQLILPLDVQVDEKRKIDFSNAALLAVSPDAVVVSGDIGQAGTISINGKVAEFKFADEPQTVRAGDALIVAVPTELAPRTWLVDGRIIVGPAYVGEQRDGHHECYCDDKAKLVYVLAADGTIHSMPVPPSDPKATNDVVIIDSLGSGSGFAEIQNQGDWRKIDGPKHLEELGAYFGYTWYRASYQSDKARPSSLMFTDATDRVHVYQSGKRIGIFGRGDGATRDPLPIELSAGENQFIFLCDNMGRLSEGSYLDLKGIGGPVCVDAQSLKINWTDPTASGKAASNSWRWQTYVGFKHPKDFTTVSGEFTVEAGQSLVISIRNITQFMWVSLNGKSIAEFGGDLSIIDETAYATYVCDQIPAGKVKLEIVAAGDPLPDIKEHVFVTSCPQAKALTNWGFRTWSEPAQQTAVAEGLPGVWKTQFPKPTLPGPIFLDTHELSKGHAYLNGHAVGRYWNIGPQLNLYLPDAWFKDQNELVIFDEEGKAPSQIHLMRDVNWPTRVVLA